MNRILLTKLEEAIKEKAPNFEVKFKDESKFMKLLGMILFSNKFFMTNYITTIGQKVYWPSKEHYESNPESSFKVLAHEAVHIFDSMKTPIQFNLGYLFPQILALPMVLFPVLITLVACSVLSPWWLLSLLLLVFLAPIPAPFRKKSEVRGYGMTLRVSMWRYGSISNYMFQKIVDNFTGPNYYFMWPFKKQVEKELKMYVQKEDPEFMCHERNPAYKMVFNILRENGQLHDYK